MLEESNSQGLLDSLIREAEDERRAILDQARAEATRIREKAAAALRAEERTGKEHLEQELQAAKLRAQSRADLKAKEISLRAQHEVLGEVFRTAETRLSEIAGTDGWSDLLKRLLRETIDLLGGDGVLEVAEEDLALCQRLAPEIAASAELRGAKDLSGGVRGVSRNGSLTCLNTLASRLKRAQETLTTEVAHILWGQA